MDKEESRKVVATHTLSSDWTHVIILFYIYVYMHACVSIYKTNKFEYAA
jgi:hypothetical protein